MVVLVVVLTEVKTCHVKIVKHMVPGQRAVFILRLLTSFKVSDSANFVYASLLL